MYTRISFANRGFLLVALLTLLTVTSLEASAQCNLLQNGQFESSGANWTADPYNPPDDKVEYIAATSPATGTQAKLTATASGGVELKQALTVTTGISYRLTINYSVSDLGSAALLQGIIRDPNTFEEVVINYAKILNRTNKSAVITIPSTMGANVELILKYSTNSISGFATVDDVYFAALPSSDSCNTVTGGNFDSANPAAFWTPEVSSGSTVTYPSVSPSGKAARLYAFGGAGSYATIRQNITVVPGGLYRINVYLRTGISNNRKLEVIISDGTNTVSQQLTSAASGDDWAPAYLAIPFGFGTNPTLRLKYSQTGGTLNSAVLIDDVYLARLY